jgi:hypothetical protein
MLMCVLGLTACGGSMSEPVALVETVGPFSAPIVTGAQWTYQSIDSVEFGAKPFAPSTLVVNAIRDTIISAQTGTILDNGKVLFEGLIGSIAMRRGTNGIATASVTSPGVTPPIVVGGWLVRLPYPVRLGMRFNSNWVVSSVDTTITVPAGTFRCVRYDLAPSDPTGPEQTMFLAPAVGVILTVRGRLDELNQAGQVIGRHRARYVLTSWRGPL